MSASERRAPPVALDPGQLVLLEIQVVQDNIARFDSNGMQIKTWCATAWTAVEAFAYESDLPRLALAGAVVAMTFALIELLYRRFQHRFIVRSREIEELLGRGDLSEYRYSVHAAATRVELGTELRYALALGHFVVFYALLAVLSVAAWWAL